MKRNPPVSVVLPFLDGERFLSEAVDSVLAQSYGHWELLLIDDGSTDASTSVAREYAASHPDRIRYLEHEGHANRGISSSRNLGIRHSRGEYIAFLDADDVWLPEKLTEQVKQLESAPSANMLYGNSLYWYSWTGRPEDRARDWTPALGVAADAMVSGTKLLELFLRGKAAVPCPCSVLVRREIVDSVGGFEEAFTGLFEDQVFYAKVLLGGPVFVSGGCWELYRRHPESICAVTEGTRESRDARSTYLRWLTDYLAQRGLERSSVGKTLRREAWLQRHTAARRTLKAGRRARRHLESLVKTTVRRLVPEGAGLRLEKWWARHSRLPIGWIRFGNFRRLSPISRHFGADRGQPLDRYYIEKFLEETSADIEGSVLEIGDDEYTRRFGGNRVRSSDVLHISPDNPKATIIGDLTDPDLLPAARFDCIILTQTLQLIYDFHAAIQSIHRALKAGGVCLITVPGITQIAGKEWSKIWHWSFTPVSARRMMEESFDADSVQVNSHGNVLVACSFLQGLATSELRQNELDHFDPSYPVLITIRAVKQVASERERE